jgi:multidrug efflux system outer membrane protein
MNRRHFTRAALAAAVSLPACVQGPDYTQPDIDPGTAYRQGGTASGTLPDEWWRLFRDDGLNRCVALALNANHDLAAARARVDTARALVGAPLAGWWPQVSAAASATKSRSSEENFQLPSGFTPDLTTSPLRSALDVSYELDLWGRVRRSVEAAEANAAAAADRLAAQRLSIAAEVARVWFLRQSLEHQAGILEETIRWRAKASAMQQSREKAGLITGADSARATAEEELARADLESVKRQRGSAEHALATLCGQAPSRFRIPGSRGWKLPAFGTGLPSSLLRRRPDLRAAEQSVVAANASIGVTQADLLPSFKLLGSGGLQSLDAASVLNWENRVLSAGPSITAPVFTGGRLKANVQAAVARRDEAVAHWRQAVITALREAEDALLDLKGLAAQDRHLAAAETASAATEAIARERYEKQVATYFEVVDANRTLLAIRLTRAQINGQRAASTAALARALGGGWSP